MKMGNKRLNSKT